MPADAPATTTPVARELAPAGLRSSPNPIDRNLPDPPRWPIPGAAAQPSGSKLPRHKSGRRCASQAGGFPDTNGPGTEKTCGSELARDSGTPATIDVPDLAPSRASSHTGGMCPTTTTPVARELAPAGLRSSPNPIDRNLPDPPQRPTPGAAAQPNGSKLPRHKSGRRCISQAGACPAPIDQALKKTVGPSLLAIAVHQPQLMYLTWPHRDQARSHRGMCLASGTSMLTALPTPWSKRPKNRANWHISLPSPPP